MSTQAVPTWPRPSSREALDRILTQHVTIRTLLWAAASIARAAQRGRPEARARLLGYVTEIRRVMEDHLDCEEALLIPILEDDLPLGPIRARLLAQEHARQRAELAELTAFGDAGDFVALTAELACLTTNLFIDMEHEENTLLRPDVIRDDIVVVDQSAG